MITLSLRRTAGRDEASFEAEVNALSKQLKITPWNRQKDSGGAAPSWQIEGTLQEDGYVDAEASNRNVHVGNEYRTAIRELCQKYFGKEPGWNTSDTIFWIIR